MAAVQLADDGVGVAGSIPEVGIAEAHVPHAERELRLEVREHDLLRHHEEAAAVDRRDRAVPADMAAAAARLDVAGEPALTCELELGVAISRGEGAVLWHGEVQLDEARGRGPAGDRDAGRYRRAPFESLRELDQRLLSLAADDVLRPAREEQLLVELRVEAVEADAHRGAQLSQAVGDAQPEPQRGVHRHGDRDEPGPPEPRRVERLDGQVEARRREARAIEERERHGEPGRRVPELIAGDEADRAGAPERQRLDGRGRVAPLGRDHLAGGGT